MAFVFTKKTPGASILITIVISFAMCEHSFAKCLKNNKALCQNVDKDLGKLQTHIKGLRRCLVAECVNASLSSKSNCMNPPKKTIPGYNSTRLDKRLKIEDFLQEILKRIVGHQVHNHEIRRHFQSGKCSNETKLMGPQLNLMKLWMNKIQKDLGFSTVTQNSKPPKLTTTGAKSKEDWYYVRVQMLVNLNHDIADIQGSFQSRSCIIPKCLNKSL